MKNNYYYYYYYYFEKQTHTQERGKGKVKG